MTYSEKRIIVDVPVSTAYDQWTDYESFPSFMSGVKKVELLGDKRLHWIAEIGGQDVEWTALITHKERNRRIGWRSTSGALNEGSVKFEPLEPNQTRVTVRIEYTPEGALEKTGSALGLVSHRIEADLERFKEFVEHPDGGPGEITVPVERAPRQRPGIEPGGMPNLHGLQGA